MQSDLLFSLLVVGLEKYAKALTPYPYPAELQHAMNGLALMMGKNFPKTRRNFLALMTDPLISWWIPNGGAEIDGFDSRFTLMYGSELSDPAENYLIEGKLRGVNISELLTLKDNAIMRRFFEDMREAYQTALDDDKATQVERDYAIVRTFVTENAYAYPDLIRRNLPYHLKDIVLEMYIPAAQQSARLLFEDSYWHCRQCGMVSIDHERNWHGLKPDVCAVRCPGNAGWYEIPSDPNVLILRSGIQRRTLIPGQPEMALYRWLNEEIHPEKSQVVDVTLYPGVDRYDIRLLFSNDEVWAVDVKDYRLPTELGAHIAQSPEPYNADPRLRWDQAFYVVADDRDHAGYCDIAWQEAGLFRHPTVKLLSMRKFKRAVEAKIWELET